MANNQPIDVATRETASFLASYLRAGAKVLEVGCGDGEVAAELMRRDYNVMALDAEPERVVKAQKLGVRAMVASWPDYGGGPFDMIAFTRSLHHIDPLGDAVQKAKKLLNPAGMLLIEDFAFGETDRATVNWFLEVLRAQAKSLVLLVEGQLVTELLSGIDPMQVWQRSYNRNLHSFAAITDAVSKCFAIRETKSVPYLYRYLIPVLPVTAPAAAFVEEVLREERKKSVLGKRETSNSWGAAS